MFAPFADLTRRLRPAAALAKTATAAASIVREQADVLRQENDVSLTERTSRLRQTWGGLDCRRSITQAAALGYEGFRRTLGIELHDVQLHAALLLTQNCIAEMQTGEGKTYTAGLAAFICAFQGRGVHVATTNGYLAERDAREISPVLEWLGVTVGVLPDTHDEQRKYAAYRCDVTYGTGSDFGFDYLRDQVRLRAQFRQRLGTDFLGRLLNGKRPAARPLQARRGVALVDEADSVLIDEAAMPLVLSGAVPRRVSEDLYRTAIGTASSLVEDADYYLDPATRSIRFSEAGWVRLHAPLRTSDVTGLAMPWADYVESSLRALHCLQRDVDYVIVEDQVQIVDPNTGRVHEERSWRGGLHQAVECKEGVPLSQERMTDGQISRQRFFRLYERVAGLTGTATGNERELEEFYRLSVRVVPTHRPCVRQQLADRVFLTDEQRNAAVVSDTCARHAVGQPVLIGTQTIDHSRRISERLHAAGVPHEVLNGLQDRAEADIVAVAGRCGAVTVATSMAGRGTDIRLDPDSLAAGGLFVAGASHHLSPRVDRQLVGRCARQGQPGVCRFYSALTDPLLMSVGEKLRADVRRSIGDDGESVGDFSEALRLRQRDYERESFQKRRAMVRRDQWMDQVLESLVKEG
ncbi:MAG: hypothetical protein NXI04_28155 [Planctomycetaceae bacterium]|nr:hypothetical protein [Planctomycetaceae bacterium]